MKRFVTSDSHGACQALRQCLERCGFDFEEDLLLFLGDVVDGWPETKESIDLLLSVRHLVYLLGNHDEWGLQFYADSLEISHTELELWLTQGGAATVKSYGVENHMPPEHLRLLLNASRYYLTPDNRLFVHAGFDVTKPLAETDPQYFLWSRDFIKRTYQLYQTQQPVKTGPFKEVYIGHTPTIALNKTQATPLQMGNVILIDTGAAFTGRLSIMNIDTKEVWQSDPVPQLYPDYPGRNARSWKELSGQV